MIKKDPTSNLLFKVRGGEEDRNLERETPELYREVFPYSEVPRTVFDNRIIPAQPPRDFWITDTTFRDGQQARKPYTVEQMVKLFEMLGRLGGKNGVIRQSEFFLYSRRDREAVEKCRSLGLKYPEITGWIRANPQDFKLVKEMGLKETGILTSVSDYHIYLKLGKNRKKAMDDYLAVVKEALSEGVIPRCHFEDATRADVYGFCVPFALELMKLSQDAKKMVKIRICDTMGFGLPYPGTALPRAVDKWVRAMIDDGGVPGEWLEWHGHNDFHKVLVNATTAWLYGCASANGTLLGWGERTGNPPIEGLVMEYISLRGEANAADTRVITEIAEYFRQEVGDYISPNYPFVGEQFNVTQAGIHADGMIKNEEIYNIFDTGKLLNRPVDVLVNDKSGSAGIAYWLNKHLKLKGPRAVDKRHPGVAKLAKWVQREYEDGGRITAISHKEMYNMAAKFLPELFVSKFDRLKEHAHTMAAHLIESLVEKPELGTMDSKVMVPVLQEFLDENPFIQFVYVVDVNTGKKTTPNIAHIEDRALYEKAGMDFDYSDRPWFKNPVKTGKVFVSDFYTSRITNRLCITVSGPVRNKKEELVGVLGADLMFEHLVKYDEMVEKEKLGEEEETVKGEKES